MQTARAEINEPDVSSEMDGKYYGLCKKNSIKSVEDFRRTVAQDPALSAYFAGFNWESARLGKLDKELWTYVAYRKGDTIRRTSKPIRLPKGDGYISDGVRTVRTYCCNDYVIAQPPVEISLSTKPDECVDGPQIRMAKSAERVDGPPRQHSVGAPSEESVGAVPEALAKVSYYDPISYSNFHETTFRVYSSPQHETIVTPEPGTMYLMGGGAAVIALLRLLRRKKE
ncbi:hypothetical protein OR1_00367 [Geobacter sp. OR-1]|nr:hypothetical protein OR1_00367 [Geobacter sp. OR-1]